LQGLASAFTILPEIFIISSIFPPEPVVSARLSNDIALELSKKNNVVVLCPVPSRPKGYQFENLKDPVNYNVIRLQSFVSPASTIIGRFRESYSFGKRSAEYIKKNGKGIDCIYINSWPLASQYLIIKEAKKINIPTVLHIQDVYPESLVGKLPKFFRSFFYRFLLPLDKYILRHSTKILGISENMVSYLSKTRGIHKSKFTVVRNWQDDEVFLKFEAAKRQQFVFTFMYVGSVSASAGVELLLYAFDKASLPDSRLVIVGNGNEKDECIRIAKELNNQHIQFLEVVPSDVPSIQSRADVLLLPLKKGISLTATPSKLTAYLFSAKPIIACVEKESDVANILTNSNCGFVTEPESVDDMEIAMKRMYQMAKADLELMGERGKKYAISNLSKKANLGRIITTIEEVI
jgi:glycosyltransferase involved in cell wall biosynthesis